MIWNEALEQYVSDHQDEVVELIRTLVAIPAFSNHEQARAEYCAKWFRDVGAEDVKIDEASNVIVTLGDVQAGKAVAFMAHLDTVFPDETGFELVEEDGWLKAPGVGDDTANVALLMVITRYLLEQKCPPKQGVLIVLNAGEEGLGNLKGCRRLMQDYTDKLSEVYSFDGSYKGYVNKAVGSVRYRVEVKTEGGHSYGAFGNRNAIRVLASLLSGILHKQFYLICLSLSHFLCLLSDAQPLLVFFGCYVIAVLLDRENNIIHPIVEIIGHLLIGPTAYLIYSALFIHPNGG